MHKGTGSASKKSKKLSEERDHSYIEGGDPITTNTEMHPHQVTVRTHTGAEFPITLWTAASIEQSPQLTETAQNPNSTNFVVVDEDSTFLRNDPTLAAFSAQNSPEKSDISLNRSPPYVVLNASLPRQVDGADLVGSSFTQTKTSSTLTPQRRFIDESVKTIPCPHKVCVVLSFAFVQILANFIWHN